MPLCEACWTYGVLSVNNDFRPEVIYTYRCEHNNLVHLFESLAIVSLAFSDIFVIASKSLKNTHAAGSWVVRVSPTDGA
jgi:hypothetical protein